LLYYNEKTALTPCNLTHPVYIYIYINAINYEQELPLKTGTNPSLKSGDTYNAVISGYTNPYS